VHGGTSDAGMRISRRVAPQRHVGCPGCASRTRCAAGYPCCAGPLSGLSRTATWRWLPPALLWCQGEAAALVVRGGPAQGRSSAEHCQLHPDALVVRTQGNGASAPPRSLANLHCSAGRAQVDQRPREVPPMAYASAGHQLSPGGGVLRPAVCWGSEVFCIDWE
jgi:hypothetical protein